MVLIAVLGVLVAGMSVTLGKQNWARPGLVAASLLWIFGAFGAHLWNAARRFNGSGIPRHAIADTAPDSIATKALLWAAAGALLGVLIMAALPYARRARAISREPGPVKSSGIPSIWLSAVSAACLVAWALGQGPSLWARDSYLAADGMGALLTATSTPAPMIAAIILTLSLTMQASRTERLVAVALGIAWWLCLLAVGTRLAVTFPVAALAALVTYLARSRRTPRMLLAGAALGYVLLFLVLYSFGISLEVRGAPHGILRLPELFTHDDLPGLFQVTSWGPFILRLVSSLAASHIIIAYSVAHAPPAWVVWANANPLPQSIAGVDAYTYERMGEYEWVPLSMVGEWYGIYGPAGQLALFAVLALVGGLSAEYLARRQQRFLGVSAMVLTIAAAGMSIQYPSRWFWRMVSLSVALPLLYAGGSWLFGRIRTRAPVDHDQRRRWFRTGPPALGLARTLSARKLAAVIGVALTVTLGTTLGISIARPHAAIAQKLPGRTIAVVIGDSYAQGGGASLISTMYTSRIAKANGWKQVNLARGGTGFVSSIEDPAKAESSCGYSSCPSFTEMIPRAVAAAPDVVIVSLSGEAMRNCSATTDNGAATFFARLRAALPSVQIIATSPIWDDKPVPPSLLELGPAIQRAVAAVGGVYVDLGNPLLDKPNLMRSDVPAPNDAGHAAIAAAFARAYIEPERTSRKSTTV